MIIEVEISGIKGEDFGVIKFNLRDYYSNAELNDAYGWGDLTFNEMVAEAILKEGNKRFGEYTWDSYSIKSIRWE